MTGLPREYRGIAQQQVGHTVAPKPAAGLHAVDVSNYTSALTISALETWKDEHDIGLVIVQAVDPPPIYPPSQTDGQLGACAIMGINTDVYLYLWTNSDVERDMRDKLRLLSGIERLVGRLWLDIEDVSAASVTSRMTAIHQAFAVLDGWSSAHGKPRPGVYTGRWWWMAYLNDAAAFSDRDLWVSQYDAIDDVDVFISFGGWATCVMKQYSGTSTLAGVSGVDLNIRRM